MSRTIPVPDQIEIDKNYAVEPIIVLKIEWSGGTKYYASKKFGNGDGSTIASASGTLMNIENFSEQIKVGNSGKINDISVQLTGLRSYYDSEVVYNTACTVSQHFISDGVLTTGIDMFVGKIASPITWNESTDILSFDVISQVPSGEYGFALSEDGSYGYTPDDDAYDVPWPIVFGKCLNVPSVRIQTGATGKITEPMTRTSTILEVEDGDKFIQLTTLRLFIGGIVVTGQFDGTQLTISTMNEAKYTSIAIAAVPGGDDDVDNYSVIWLNANVDVKGTHLYSSILRQYNYCYRQETIGGITKVWCSHKWGSFSNQVWVDSRPTIITEVAGAPRDSWAAPPMQFIFGFVVKTDSAVYRINTDGTIHSDSQVKYVAGLFADTVLDVKAYRTLDKEKVLCNIPSSYYTKTIEDVGAGFNSLTITMDQLLSSRDREGWSDELFVSIDGVQSSNTSILLKWLIDTYTNLSTNTSSFGTSALNNYPSNFVLFGQGDTMKICEEIAWQARCSLKIVNDTVYLIYLSLIPSSVKNIDDDDFEIKTTHLSLSDETEIITKFIATWKQSYSPEDNIQTYMKKENISAYGLTKQEFSFYIYNVKEWVEKSTTFWAHRYANVWKQLIFNSFLNNIGLEATDAVFLQTTLHNIISTATICLVQSISIEQLNGLVNLELWLPVLAGAQIADANAWMTDGEGLIDVDVSNLREYDYEVELEEADSQSRSSIQTEEKTGSAIPRSIEGWTLIATTLENVQNRSYIYCSILNIDAPDWIIGRIPDYIIGEPVKHGSILAVCKLSHASTSGNQPVVDGNDYWYDCDNVAVQYTQPNPNLTMKDMEPAFIKDMDINVSFASGVFIFNGQLHPETLMGRVMQFKCTEDAPAQVFIAAKLTQFDNALPWTTTTYMQRHKFVIHSSRLFECLKPHESELVFSQPISGSVWTSYWFEWITDNIYFEIKGATNLDDLNLPFETGDLLHAKYDLYQDRWNGIEIQYKGGGGKEIAYCKEDAPDADEITCYLGADLLNWDSGKTYDIDNWVEVAGIEYKSLQNDNTNHAVSDGTWWEVGTISVMVKCLIINGSSLLYAGPPLHNGDPIFVENVIVDGESVLYCTNIEFNGARFSP